MQAAALASSLGFALVGGAMTGGWRKHSEMFCHSKIDITFEQTSCRFSYGNINIIFLHSSSNR